MSANGGVIKPIRGGGPLLDAEGSKPETVIDTPRTLASVGSWTTGLSDFIDDAHFEALKRMSGLTIDPDILHINGNTHTIRDGLDNDTL